MMWGYYDATSWWWMVPLMIFFWGAVATFIVILVRAFAQPRGHDGAMDVLRRRLASGEINQEEFDRIRHAIGG